MFKDNWSNPEHYKLWQKYRKVKDKSVLLPQLFGWLDAASSFSKTKECAEWTFTNLKKIIESTLDEQG